MTAWSNALVEALSVAFIDAADSERAEQQEAYLRDQFPFFGIGAPQHKAILSAALREIGRPTPDDVDAFARQAYGRDQREWHHAAVKTTRRYAKLLEPTSVSLVHHLVMTHSWWDTVDEIASHLAGTLVQRHPETVAVMDEWSRSEHLWLARTAILHQLRFGDRTDEGRLFDYCLARADERDFFSRKAIGWALRHDARTRPDAVREFCAANQHRLSNLSLREAQKNL